jgi:hypothetical protein
MPWSGRNPNAAALCWAPLKAIVMRLKLAAVAFLGWATPAYGKCVETSCFVVTFEIAECSEVEYRGQRAMSVSIKPLEVTEEKCWSFSPPITDPARRRPPSWAGTFQIRGGPDMTCTTSPKVMRRFWSPKCCDIVGSDCPSAPELLRELPPWAK